ncbi:hypothetical protein COEREDRAFT_79068, partial [Coemansia reversa NRRL 1564]
PIEHQHLRCLLSFDSLGGQYFLTSSYASLVSIHSQQKTAYPSTGKDTQQTQTKYHIINILTTSYSLNKSR